MQDNRGIKAHDAPKLRRQSKRIRDGGAAISDSLFEQIQGAAPHDARLTPVENAKALAYAATDALAARRQRLPRKKIPILRLGREFTQKSCFVYVVLHGRLSM